MGLTRKSFIGKGNEIVIKLELRAVSEQAYTLTMATKPSEPDRSVVIIGNAVSSLTEPIGLATNLEVVMSNCSLCNSDEHEYHYVASVHTSSTVVLDLLVNLQREGLIEINGVMDNETGEVD